MESTAECILAGLVGAPSGGKHRHSFDALSDRERRVVHLLAEGLSTREIAHALRVAFKAVEAHYAHIKHEAGLGSGRELRRLAVLWAGGHVLP